MPYAPVADARACVCVVCRAGELSPEELESIMTIVANPRAYKVPDWFLNRQKDVRDGRFSQVRRAKGTGSGLLSPEIMLCLTAAGGLHCICPVGDYD